MLPQPEADPDRFLDRRVRPIRPIQQERLCSLERWLRKETRPRSAMRLRGMNQKWMTQVHRPSLAGRQDLLALGAIVEPLARQFP